MSDYGERKGVWVVGPSRSGTSMVAGLFAAHGVFFGESISANEYNPKGYFENIWLKDFFKGRLSGVDWPKDFFRELSDQGWCPCDPWGAKTGPAKAVLMLALKPTLIVVCRRPIDQIARSRGRVHWAKGAPRNVAERGYERVEEMAHVAEAPIVDVHTDELVHGAYGEIREAFELLDVEFDREIAERWIDPTIWDRG